MILGELTLIDKTGIFLKEQVSDHSSIDKDPDRLEDSRYLEGFDLECGVTETELVGHIPSHLIEPLEIESKGDYIMGAFKDSGFATGTYTVKVWLMIEEEPLILAK